MAGGYQRRKVEEPVGDIITRMFLAVDAIDQHIADKKQPLPARGVIPCPNCGARLTYLQLTELQGAARCATEGCVEFSPIAKL